MVKEIVTGTRALLAGILALALTAGLLAGCDSMTNENPVTHTVSFDKGGGGGTAPASRAVNANEAITLPGAEGMTAPGDKVFGGWKAGETVYAAGASYTVTGDITFTAQWGDPDLVTYTVTFDKGEAGGTAPASRVVNAGEATTLPGTDGMTAPDNKVFGGWKTGETVYAAEASYTVTGDITFAAQWDDPELVTYTVTFDKGEAGGTAPANRVVNAGEATTLPGADGMTAPGNRVFGGWKAGETVYAAEFSYTATGDITFAAQWDEPPFVPVSNISGVPEKGTPGEEIDLSGAEISPADATGTVISWTVKEDGGIGLSTGDIGDNKFTPANAGTLVLTASVADGAAIGTPYTQEFTIELSYAAGAKKAVTAAGIAFNQIYVPKVTDGFKATDAGFTPKISKGYWMGETEVTRELWQAVMTGSDNNAAPSNTSYDTDVSEAGTAGTFPVGNISWYDCLEFCNGLSVKAGKEPVYAITNITRNANKQITAADVTWDLARNGYRLPTWAEWMWAAMGATEGGDTVKEDGYLKAFAGAADADASFDTDYVWYAINSNTKAHHVGLKLPNEMGLFDMSGNIGEWVWNSLTNPVTIPYTGYVGDGTDYLGEGGNISPSSITRMPTMGRFFLNNQPAQFVLKDSLGNNTKNTIAFAHGLRVVCGE
jgi:formylglycine-generating enzyme required for sulfatase activity